MAVVLIGNKTAEHTERKQNQRDIVTFKDKAVKSYSWFVHGDTHL